jgi:DNA-binding transcriptional LysR family regulator
VSIPAGFTSTICARLTTYAYARKGRPLAARRKITLEGLARQTWVLSTRTAGQAFISACAKVGLKGPSIVARVNSFESLRGLVETSDWVTILPSEIVGRYYGDSFARLYSEEFQFRINLVVLHARDLEMTLPPRTLIGAIRDAISIES